MRFRTTIGPLCFALLFSVASPADAATKAQRKLDHKVEQALLYIGMKLPERAKETLQDVVSTEPGKSDALAWLGLARANYALQRLDEAGQALGRAEGLGAAKRLSEKKWAAKFYGEFKERVGSVRLRGVKCKQVKFRAKLATPMVNPGKRALLGALPGWRQKELERPTSTPFFLPAGQYFLGKTRVRVIAGEETGITGPEVEAQCTDLPKIAAVDPKGGTGATTTGPGPQAPAPNFLADNWVWLAVGLVAVAGGTTAAMAATREREVGLTLF